MQVSKHIHALKVPFEITDPSGKIMPRFVYVYLIYDQKIVLIDSGVASSERAILDYLKNTGRSISEISNLILTHAHPDHIGAAEALRKESNFVVSSHRAERAWIEDIDLQEKERPVPGFRSLVNGSVHVDRILKDGDIIDAGDGQKIHVIHTPGHSPGSISLWMPEEGALFCADAIPIPGDMPIYQDILQSFRSIQKLKSIPKIKLLLAAWDDPRKGSEAYRIMNQGLDYLQEIHSAVLKAAAAEAGLESIELCRRVLRELGLPEIMANPLVAGSFQSSLGIKNTKDLQKNEFLGKDHGCII